MGSQVKLTRLGLTAFLHEFGLAAAAVAQCLRERSRYSMDGASSCAGVESTPMEVTGQELTPAGDDAVMLDGDVVEQTANAEVNGPDGGQASEMPPNGERMPTKPAYFCSTQVSRAPRAQYLTEK